MTTRRLPRWTSLRPLLRLQRPRLGRAARLERVLDVAEMRELARRRVPKAVFDFVEGAAEDEVTLNRARRAFADVVFRGEVLRDVSSVDVSTNVLGAPSALPFAFAPTGFTRMSHTAGEHALAAVADRAGIPMSLSTMGSVSIEDLAPWSAKARRWFQLYVWRDRGATRDLIRRAAAAGYEALIVTVDVPIGGARYRDTRNGFSFPPSLSVRTFLDGVRHPAWTFDFLTTEPLGFASLRDWDGTTGESLVNRLFDSSITFDDLAWVRSEWPGALVVKGVQTPADARAAAAVGADAVVVSTHGGRQLDRAAATLDLLPPVRQEIGDDAEVWLDTGILSGGDIVAALALGADFTLLGRASLYGLMAGGEAGARRVIEIIETQLRRTLALVGTTSLDGLSSDVVARPTFDPR